MKILVVCSFNTGKIPVFVIEQVNSLSRYGIVSEYFLIKGKGMIGYLSNFKEYKRKIQSFKPDLIHAHYGISGLFANLQREVAVITTFHGSDINIRSVRILSKLAMILSSYSIFVSEKMVSLASVRKNYSVISCGINLTIFKPLDKYKSREILGWNEDEKVVLFSGSFSNKVKNYSLARDAIRKLNQPVRLIELIGYSREQVNLLLNACDSLLLTSLSEGSPNIIKEALACNCPIVSTDVGDVKEITRDVKGTFICDFTVDDVAKKLESALDYNTKTDGRHRVIHLDHMHTATKICQLYHRVSTN